MIKRIQDQYNDLKKELPENVLLLFQLGDYWEAFGDDAKIIAHILKIALTKRNEVPMTGIPYHMKDRSIKTLVKAGYRVALAELTEPKNKPLENNIREISEIIND